LANWMQQQPLMQSVDFSVQMDRLSD